MHDPLLHVKDSYFFEIPGRLWHYHNLAEVPAYLRDAHPEIKDVDIWDKALAGKVLIPQWFGTPKNLYERGSGFCISRFMVLELVAALLLVVVFTWVARKSRQGDAPRGRLWNMCEAILAYFRDEVVRPAVGHHDADRFVPLLWTMFLFVLTCNLLGMVPWAGSPTAAFGATVAIAAVTLLTGVVFGIIRFGPVGFWLHFVPHMDLPWYAAPIIKPLLFLIEIGGMLIRHGILAVRLLANMVAGHIVLAAILGLIVAAATASMGQWATVTVIAVVGSTLLSCLELFVAILQAYVFTFLSALFLGAALHEH